MPAVFDGHNDALTSDDHAQIADGRSGGHLDLPRMRAGGVRGAIFAVFTRSDGGAREHPGAARRRGDRVRARAAGGARGGGRRRERGRRAAARARAGRARCGSPVAAPISIARWDDADGPPVAVLHLEGAEAIDPGLEALELWYEAGLRSVGPVWSRPNAFAHGVPFISPSSPDTGPGLTDAGRALVRRCAELGILIDVSHLNEAGFWDVARARRGADRGHPLGRARAVPDVAEPDRRAARRDRDVRRPRRDRVRGAVPAGRFRR